MKITQIIFSLAALLAVSGCAHNFSTAETGGRKLASISQQNKIEFPGLGLTFVMKDKSIGVPVAAIFDKDGEFFPEIQSKINKMMKSQMQVGFNVTAVEVRNENMVYKDSKETYSTLIVSATTVNGLNNKEQALKFAVPIERMLISQKGGKASGFGYWNTTDVRVLDPQQKFPF